MNGIDIGEYDRIYLDTGVVIRIIEGFGGEYANLRNLFVQNLGQQFVTSSLTLLEALVKPYRDKNAKLISAYEKLLFESDLVLEDITFDVLRRAITVRADLRLKTPDAIHVATAHTSQCDLILTTDQALRAECQIAVQVLPA
jgi:predicted nucleic acid-binding protein